MMSRTGLCLAVLAVLAAAACASPMVHATSDARLAETLGQRLHGDRTGACFAAAVVEPGSVSRAFVCADPSAPARIGPDSAFEIGSVSKTMTAALLAELIRRGEGSLNDPLADWLPEGTAVPAFEGQPILLRHVVTHSAGLPALPPGVPIANPADPYAAMAPDDVLQALGRVELARPPGAATEYSNFASMLLSLAVARRAGMDFEQLAEEWLFTPLDMAGAYVEDRPEGVRVAAGHLPTGAVAPAWNFHADMAGVGGVRATLDDMVAYVQGQMGQRETPLRGAFDATQQLLEGEGGTGFAMNWMVAMLDDRSVHMHEGGTGGFSSLVAFDRARGRGVVVLSDTSLHSLGGLGGIGRHLLDEAFPLDGPRTVATPEETLLDGLAGSWQVQGMPMEVRRKGGTLEVQVAGQPPFELGYDSEGDFYPLQFDGLLRPSRNPDGSHGFSWIQFGGAAPAVRVRPDAGAKGQPAEKLGPEVLEQYAGHYPLMAGFTLVISAADGRLQGQATGQGRFALEPAGKDVFRAPAFGIEIRFQRTGDEVTALELHQAGQVLRGERQQ